MARLGLSFTVLVVLVAVTLPPGLSIRATPRTLKSNDDAYGNIPVKILDVGMGDEPSHDEQDCFRFFARHMPPDDHKNLHYGFIHNQIHLSLKARSDNDWALDVPWDIFLNNVLPYANLDEPREDWRSSFYERFAPLVAGTATTLEAATALNYQIWTLDGWNITFKSNQTPDIMSPSQVIEHGYASCTGLAIFFVDACRAVGIPARVAGIAEWPGTGGNHNWVEVWHNGAWSFTDPIGFPNRPWNQTWFFPDPVRKAVPYSYAHGVYGASFKHTGRLFPMAWHDEYESAIPGYDVTEYYIKAAAAVPAAAVKLPAGTGATAQGGDVIWGQGQLQGRGGGAISEADVQGQARAEVELGARTQAKVEVDDEVVVVEAEPKRESEALVVA